MVSNQQEARVMAPHFFIGICLTGYLIGLSYGIEIVLLPLLFEAHGFSKTVIGILNGINMCAVIAVAPVLMRILARYGIERVLIGACLLRGLMLLCIPFGHSFSYWAVTLFLLGSAGWTTFGTIQITLNQLSSKKRRGISIGAFLAAVSFGVASGPICLLPVGREGTLPFMVAALVTLCTLSAIVMIKKHLPVTRRSAQMSLKECCKKANMAIYSDILSNYIFTSFSSFIVLYGMSIGMSQANASLMITSMLVGNIILELILGWVSDKVNRKHLLIASALVIALGVQLLHWGPSLISYLPIIFGVLSGMLAGIYTASLALLGDNFSDNDLVKVTLAFSFLGGMGGIAGVVITGIAMDLWGYHGLPLSIGVACLVYTGFYIYGTHHEAKKAARLSRAA